MMPERIFDHPLIGRRVFCDAGPATVTMVQDHAPGTHDASPIYNTLTAREFVTARGSRWTSVAPDGDETIPPLDIDAPSHA